MALMMMLVIWIYLWARTVDLQGLHLPDDSLRENERKRQPSEDSKPGNHQKEKHVSFVDSHEDQSAAAITAPRIALSPEAMFVGANESLLSLWQAGYINHRNELKVLQHKWITELLLPNDQLWSLIKMKWKEAERRKGKMMAFLNALCEHYFLKRVTTSTEIDATPMMSLWQCLHYWIAEEEEGICDLEHARNQAASFVASCFAIGIFGKTKGEAIASSAPASARSMQDRESEKKELLSLEDPLCWPHVKSARPLCQAYLSTVCATSLNTDNSNEDKALSNHLSKTAGQLLMQSWFEDLPQGMTYSQVLAAASIATRGYGVGVDASDASNEAGAKMKGRNWVVGRVW